MKQTKISTWPKRMLAVKKIIIHRVLAGAAMGGFIASASLGADAVSVDAAGNTAFAGSVTVSGQLGAPNILQGAPGIAIGGAITLSSASFGQWHWISGTAIDYDIMLPDAAGQSGKLIGLRTKGVVNASRVYTVKASGAQLIDGMQSFQVIANSTIILMSDGTGWARIGSVAAGVPPGTVIAYGGTSVPSGWLLCSGQAVSRTQYPELFAALSVGWGSGDGSSTFNVPDLRRRTLVGSGGMGSLVLGNQVAAKGGEESHVITQAEMPAHQHNIAQIPAGSYGSNAWAHVQQISAGGTQPGTNSKTEVAGQSIAMSLIQPSAIVQYIIKY